MKTTYDEHREHLTVPFNPAPPPRRKTTYDLAVESLTEPGEPARSDT